MRGDTRTKDIVAEASRRLATAGIETARLDAELLMAEAAGVSRIEILAKSIALSDEVLGKFEAMIKRRESREPLAYITGRKEFYSLDFEVTPAVLIPRPETEFVVTAALEAIGNKPNARVLDIGTGSGAIAIAIAANAPGAIVTAVDISSEALDVERRNAQRLGVADRMRFALADVYDLREDGPPLGIFDVIVSNPPYVSRAEVASLAPEIRNHEPAVALSDNNDGLDFYRRIVSGARAHLTSDGAVIVEIGADQQLAIAEIFSQAGLTECTVTNDLAGIPRVLIATFPHA